MQGFAKGDKKPEKAVAPGQKQTASNTPPLKGGVYYENRISNVSCTQVGAVYKVVLTVTAKNLWLIVKPEKKKKML